MIKPKRKKYSFLLYLVIVVVLVGCDAPRKNPLDSQNPNVTFGELRGSVKAADSPSTPLPGVTLTWKEERLAVSDDEGKYLFQGVAPEDGWLHYSRNGFRSDSVMIKWGGRTSIEQDVFLQAAPEITGQVASVSGAPVSKASVFWVNENLYTTTDADGRYRLAAIDGHDGWLVFRKDGFRADSVFIEWDGAGSLTRDITLVPLPTLRGHVKTMRVPPQPIANVKVTWLPQQHYVYTDDQGFYSFENLAAENGQLVFEHADFRTETENIEWGADAVVTRDIFLNSNPTLDSLTLYSVVEHNYGPRLEEQLYVFAYIADEEGDIHSVSIECSSLDISAELSYNVQHKRFERAFTVNDLNINSMRQLVGYDFELNVLDDYDAVFHLGSDRVERVILDEIEIDSPKNSAEISNPVTLQWLYFNPGFPFTYDIEIYTDDDFTQELVWQKKGIPPDSLSASVEVTLESKEYVWMIWCVDEFNNRSRSKPGSFSVVE